MSKVTEIRDRLESIISTALPSYAKLSDVIEADDNAVLLLDKGFSVAYGGSQGVYDQWCMGKMRQQREFRVALTNIYMTASDQAYRKSLENALVEDEFLVIGAVTRDFQLTGGSENEGVAINTVFAFDQGIQYMVEESTKKQFILIVLSFVVDYIEGV